MARTHHRELAPSKHPIVETPHITVFPLLSVGNAPVHKHTATSRKFGNLPTSQKGRTPFEARPAEEKKKKKKAQHLGLHSRGRRFG